MENAALAAELRALADDAPDLKAYDGSSRRYHEWLGKLYALVLLWEPKEASDVLSWTNYLNNPYMREEYGARLLSLLFRAIAVVSTETKAQTGHVFGPGAAYDFFKTFRDLLKTATQSILVVDPYLDDTILGDYLTSVSKQVSTRLLVDKYANTFKPAAPLLAAQNQMKVEVRKSNSIHDRVLFLDNASCWVLGQSIKDAANSKPTYLAPLDAEMTAFKKADYEEIWATAALV